jgi:hypothetical protein
MMRRGVMQRIIKNPSIM